MSFRNHQLGFVIVWILLTALLISGISAAVVLYTQTMQNTTSTTKPVPGTETNYSIATPSANRGVPLGPKTEEFFDKVTKGMAENVSSNAAVMQSYTPEVCDINTDGVCNEADKQAIRTRIGQCRLDNNYHPLADSDIDGCITETDYQMVFGNN